MKTPRHLSHPRIGRILPLGGVAVLFVACSLHHTYPAFDSVAHLRRQYAERLGAEKAPQVVVPFELNEELRVAVDKRLSPAGSVRDRVDMVLAFIFSNLNLRYSLVPTRSAVETSQVREGNCLSFVNLFVGVARHVRLNPFYVEVEDHQRWNYQAGVVVSRGHIVAGMQIDGNLATFDFLPYRPKSYRRFKPIDDLTATAHYYNNLGAEALIEGDLRRARGLLEVAVGLDPGFDKALNNLGVCLLRMGEIDEAVALFRRGLETHPKDVALLSNLARAYQQLGRNQEAVALLDQIEGLNKTNPFFFVYRSELALSQGDPDGALRHLAQALRIDSEVPEVHLGFVKAYLALGNLQRARHHLERALTLDATHAEARKYATLLERQEGKP